MLRLALIATIGICVRSYRIWKKCKRTAVCRNSISRSNELVIKRKLIGDDLAALLGWSETKLAMLS